METKTIQKYVLIVCALSSFVITVTTSSVNVALSTIGRDLMVSTSFLTWLQNIYLLIGASFMIPFGRLGEIHGKKKIMTYGIIVFTIGSLLCAVSTSGDMLMFFRAIQAIGSAMIFSNIFSLITSVSTPGEGAKILGIAVAIPYIGLSLGPVLGGILTNDFGWRSIFLFNVPFGIAATYFILKLEGEWCEAVGEKFDYISSIVLALSLTAIIYGLSIITDATAPYIILAGMVGVIIFFYLQGKLKVPLIDPEIIHDRIFLINNTTSLINYGPGIFVTFLLSLYFQDIRLLSAQDAGLLLAVQSVFVAIFSAISGRLSVKIRPRFIAATGIFITSFALALFVSLGEYTSYYFIIAALAILGCGYGLSATASTEISMRYFDKKFRGVSSASLNTTQYVGQMLGMGITGAGLAIYMGAAHLTPQNFALFIEAFKLPFEVFAVACFIVAFAYFIPRK
jgi:MFS family permease